MFLLKIRDNCSAFYIFFFFFLNICFQIWFSLWCLIYIWIFQSSSIFGFKVVYIVLGPLSKKKKRKSILISLNFNSVFYSKFLSIHSYTYNRHTQYASIILYIYYIYIYIYICTYVLIYVYVFTHNYIYLTNPSTQNKMKHRVNFK